MGLLSKLLFYFWARIRGHKVIRLVGEPRPGDHMFVSSPDLPGFSFMLRPGEHEDIGSVMAVIQEPLKQFIVAEFDAKMTDDKQRKVLISATRQTDPASFLAEFCTT